MRPMRRSDREVTDAAKIEQIVQSCGCMRVGFNDGGEVYIVPISFGYEIENGRYRFYFHGASEGRKAELIRDEPRVGFEMDAAYRVYGEGGKACVYSAAFVSVIGTGRMCFVTDAVEKQAGLQAIMRHTAGCGEWEFDRSMLETVCVMRLDAETMSAKEHE